MLVSDERTVRRYRVLVSAEAVRGEVLAITEPSRVHHLADVLRVKVGERLECFDGEGRAYVGPLIRRTRRELTVKIDERVSEPAPPCRVSLIQALIRPERFEWIVEKATELGVERMVPVTTARTQRRLVEGRAAAKVARWRRIAEEAATQCGRMWVPAIEAPQPLERVWPRLEGMGWVVVPTPGIGAEPLTTLLRAQAGIEETAVLIGSEGGFTEDELKAAVAHGATLASLGRLTLRAETAALIALAVVTQMTMEHS